MRAPCLILAAMMMLAAGTARADPVLVMTGTDQIGQGWRFRHGERCLVATARHVLPRGVGSIITQSGEYGQIVLTDVSVDPDVDIAVAAIMGKAAQTCPLESLGFPDSHPALQEASEGNRTLRMYVVYLCGVRTRDCGARGFDVKVDTLSPVDPIFWFRLSDTYGFGVQGGDSGAILVHTGSDGTPAGEPLGIAVDVQTGGARKPSAVVFSEVRALLPTIPTTPIGSIAREQKLKSGRFRLVDFGGKLLNADCGPVNALSGSGICPFQAAPDDQGRPVELVVAAADEASVHGFRFAFDPEDPLPDGVEIAVEDGRAEDGAAAWQVVRYCVPDAADFTCRVAGFRAARYRIRFNGSVVIHGISEG